MLAAEQTQPTGRTLRRLARPAGVVAANGFNSASNLLLVVLLARSMDAKAFGAISVVLTGLLLAAVFIRGLVVEPLIAAGDRVSPRAAVRHVSASSGIVASAAVAGALALGASGGVAVGLALGAGATIALDVCRWTLVKQSRQLRAATIDLVWLLAQVGTALLISTSAETTAVAWGSAGVFAVLLAILGVNFSPQNTALQGLKVRVAWGIENVVAASGAQLAIVAVPLTAGLEATGSLRGASSLLGFTTVLVGAMHQLGLIRMTAAAQSPRKVVSLGARLSICVAVLVLLSAVPLLLIDGETGVRLLGDTWKGSRSVLPWLIVQKALVVLVFGAMLVTRVLDLRPGIIRDRSILAVASVLAGLLGGATAGASGAAIGIDAVALATVIIWVRRVTRALPALAVAPLSAGRSTT